MLLKAVCLSTCIAVAAASNNAWRRETHPWRSSAAMTKSESWFDELQYALNTMQTEYWNGTYWPTTIDWIGAVLDTLLAGSDRSFTNALVEYNGDVPGSTNSSTDSIDAEIHEYFEDIEGYYGSEAAGRIFDEAYDDVQWVVLDYLEAIKFINQYDDYAKSDLGKDDIADFAHRAHIFYNVVQDKYDTSLCDGGLTWNPTLAPYKNAITNTLFVSSSVGMYLYFPGDDNTDPKPSPDYSTKDLPSLQPLKAHDQSLLDNAVKEYEWFKTHNYTNAQGLVVDGFHISDGQTSCDQRNEMVYTYNQGVVLSGLRQLWEATGDTSYLDDGYALVQVVINATGWNAETSDEAAQWSGLGRNGIMEDYCDAPADCSQDNQMFKGIYFHHLDLFCEPLPTETPLVDGLTKLASSKLASQHDDNCQSYLPWIQHNAMAALSTRNASGIIGGWWGASYVNKDQAPAPEYTEPRPANSHDEFNFPSILKNPLWACHGQHGCDPNGLLGNIGGGLRRNLDGRYRRRDINDEGRGRTVETQGSGLGVVKAASDIQLKRPAM